MAALSTGLLLTLFSPGAAFDGGNPGIESAKSLFFGVEVGKGGGNRLIADLERDRKKQTSHGDAEKSQGSEIQS